MLALALILGGAGIDYPLLEASIEVAAIALVWYISLQPRAALDTKLTQLPLAIAIALVLIPIVQLIPLPPAIWTQLPGRELATSILKLIAAKAEWRPLSLDPGATLRSGLALLPGLAMFLAVTRLSRRDQLRLVYVLIAVALFSAVLGALQRGMPGPGTLNLYGSDQGRLASGLFVNLNHQATFLAVAIVMTAAAARANDHRRNAGPIRLAAIAAIAVLAGGTVATTSRMGFALLIMACVAAAFLLFPVRRSWTRIATVIAPLTLIGLVTVFSFGGTTVMSRFLDFTDERALYWQDAAIGIRDFWPVGSGLGTWGRVYPMVESLDVLGNTVVNNAHNDYVEVILEAGAPAFVLLLLFFGFMGFALLRLRRLAHSGHSIAIGLAAWIAIVLVMLHSIVDYPLRMLSIMATFGLLAGLLTTALHPPSPGRERHSARTPK